MRHPYLEVPPDLMPLFPPEILGKLAQIRARATQLGRLPPRRQGAAGAAGATALMRARRAALGALRVRARPARPRVGLHVDVGPRRVAPPARQPALLLRHRAVPRGRVGRPLFAAFYVLSGLVAVATHAVYYAGAWCRSSAPRVRSPVSWARSSSGSAPRASASCFSRCSCCPSSASRSCFPRSSSCRSGSSASTGSRARPPAATTSPTGRTWGGSRSASSSPACCGSRASRSASSIPRSSGRCRSSRTPPSSARTTRAWPETGRLRAGRSAPRSRRTRRASTAGARRARSRSPPATRRSSTAARRACWSSTRGRASRRSASRSSRRRCASTRGSPGPASCSRGRRSTTGRATGSVRCACTSGPTRPPPSRRRRFSRSSAPATCSSAPATETRPPELPAGAGPPRVRGPLAGQDRRPPRRPAGLSAARAQRPVRAARWMARTCVSTIISVRYSAVPGTSARHSDPAPGAWRSQHWIGSRTSGRRT